MEANRQIKTGRSKEKERANGWFVRFKAKKFFRQKRVNSERACVCASRLFLFIFGKTVSFGFDFDLISHS
jgi:hypothetical protein